MAGQARWRLPWDSLTKPGGKEVDDSRVQENFEAIQNKIEGNATALAQGVLFWQGNPGEVQFVEDGPWWPREFNQPTVTLWPGVWDVTYQANVTSSIDRGQLAIAMTGPFTEARGWCAPSANRWCNVSMGWRAKVDGELPLRFWFATNQPGGQVALFHSHVSAVFVNG